MDQEPAPYPANPRYGSGVLRRRVSFAVSPGAMNVALLDQFHHMLVRLHHDGVRITGVEGEMRRWPKTTCPGAVAMLKVFEGCAILEGRRGAEARVIPSTQCTHLSDMAILGLSALQRGVERQCIEIALADRDPQGRQQLEIMVDGAHALHWRLEHQVIVEPAQYAGRSVFGGFSRWAAGEFVGFERDLWQMAQMAVLIAGGREYVTDGPARRPISASVRNEGACHSFSGEAYRTGHDIAGYVIDMSAGLPPRCEADELLGG